MSYKLFLDDERFPVDPENWIIVRNYFEFMNVLNEMGPPAYVSFDHDLGQTTGNGLTCASGLINYDMDRWEGAPKQLDARYIFPDARSIIGLVFRIPRGYLRGIEEGTFFSVYPFMGYAGLNWIYMPIVLREICCFIEDHGYEAVPIPR